jgi:hypothetical protein
MTRQLGRRCWPHVEQPALSARQHKVALNIQDNTNLDFNG